MLGDKAWLTVCSPVQHNTVLDGAGFVHNGMLKQENCRHNVGGTLFANVSL